MLTKQIKTDKLSSESKELNSAEEVSLAVITIKEIAKLAGVSRGTVDRALNNRKGISEEVKNKILQIAEEHNYVPNKNARKLKTLEEEKIIGALLSKKSEIYFKRIIQGINSAKNKTEDSRLRIEIISVDNFDSQAILENLEYFKQKKVDGLLTAVMHSEEIAAKMDEIVETGIPIITLVTDVKCRRLGFFGENAVQSGEIMASLFLKTMKDEMNLLAVIGNPKFSIHQERMTAFEKFMDDREIAYQVKNIIYSDEEYEHSYKRIGNILKKSNDINAVYMSTGDAKALMDVLKELELKKNIFGIAIGYEADSHGKCLSEGYLGFAIDSRPEEIGYRAFKAIYDYLVFKEVPKAEKNYIETSIKISENI